MYILYLYLDNYNTLMILFCRHKKNVVDVKACLVLSDFLKTLFKIEMFIRYLITLYVYKIIILNAFCIDYIAPRGHRLR